MKTAVGYACKLVGVPHTAIRSLTLKNAQRDKLLEAARHNLAALLHMVEYNRRAGIGLFRISSDFIPFASHPDVDFPWRKLCASELAAAGNAIAATGLRVSMHPGQYTVLNSPDSDVAERAVADVVYHADFLDALNTGPDAKIVLHVGGVYGDKAAGRRRFADRFRSLPPRAARRIVLENDERNYAIDEVCELASSLNIPALLDVFHHALLPPDSGGTPGDWLRAARKTWRREDGRQKIHYSQQLAGGRPGTHSRTIRIREFMDFHRTLPDLPLDIMLEVKDKNVSALKCAHCLAPRLRRAALTDAWAWYKYAVLEHDAAAYGRIRSLLKNPRPAALDFYAEAEAALARQANAGGVANAAEHVWGYFKDKADAKERGRFETLLARAHETSGNAALKRHLLALAEKYGEAYIASSLYLYLPAEPVG